MALVALFDAPLPSICDDVDVEDDAALPVRPGELRQLLRRHRGAGRLRRTAGAAAGRAIPSGAGRSEARKAPCRQPTPEEYIRRLVHVGEANVRVIQSYEPRPLAAPVHLFVPTIEGGLAQIAGRAWDESGDHGWGSEVGQALELHKVPGDHFTMMVGAGAAQIAQLLEAAACRRVGGQEVARGDSSSEPSEP